MFDTSARWRAPKCGKRARSPTRGPLAAPPGLVYSRPHWGWCRRSRHHLAAPHLVASWPHRGWCHSRPHRTPRAPPGLVTLRAPPGLVTGRPRIHPKNPVPPQ
jgi:hypothetical protein